MDLIVFIIDLKSLASQMKCDDVADFIILSTQQKAIADKAKSNKIDGSLLLSYLNNDDFLNELLGITDQVQRSKFRCLFMRQLLNKQKSSFMAEVSVENAMKFCKSIPLLQESAKVQSYYNTCLTT